MPTGLKMNSNVESVERLNIFVGKGLVGPYPLVVELSRASMIIAMIQYPFELTSKLYAY